MFFCKDFSLYIKTFQTIGKNLLPYAVNYLNTDLIISWDRDNVQQKAYILELRSSVKHRRSDGGYGLNYYSSGLKYSKNNYHIIPASNFNTSWKGLCEVRLRLFDYNDDEYCTHEETYTDYYEFEKVKKGNSYVQAPQFRKWGITNPSYYFVMQDEIETTKSQSLKLNIVQNNTKIEISDNPLFLSNSNTHPFADWNVNDLITFFPEVQGRLLLKSDIMYFYRIWGDVVVENSNSQGTTTIQGWQLPQAFFRSSNVTPLIRNLNVRIPNSTDETWLTDEQISRNHGEMVIELDIVDTDSNYVNLTMNYYSEDDDNIYPCVINAPLFKLPTNQSYKFLWLTYFYNEDNNKSNSNADAFITLKGNKDYTLQIIVRDAKNDYNTSTIDCRISNSNTAPDNGTIFTSAEFNIKNHLGKYDKYPFYPVEAIQHRIEGSMIVGSKSISKLAQIFSNSYLSFNNDDEWQSEGMDDSSKDDFWMLSNSNTHLKIYCPECIKHYKLSPLKLGKLTVQDSQIINGIKFSNVKRYNFEEGDFASNSYMRQCSHCKRWYKDEDGIRYENDNDIYCANCGQKSLLTVKYPKNNHEDLQFYCASCGKFYDKQMVFNHLHTDIYPRIKNVIYSLYHGYSSTEEANNKLRKDLQLVDNIEISNSEKFVPIFSNSASKNIKYGILSDDKQLANWNGLRKLNPRPQIQPYIWIHTPQIKYQNRYALYTDGADLLLDSQKDYQHNYGLQVTGEQGNPQEKRLVDESMHKMSKQGLWNYMDAFSYAYTMPPSKNNEEEGRDWLFPKLHPWMKLMSTEVNNKNLYYIVKHIYTKINTPRRIVITEGVNDKFCYIVNGEKVQGSLFGTFYNIFTNNNENILTNVSGTVGNRKCTLTFQTNGSMQNINVWRNIILALFTDIVKYKNWYGEWRANILRNDGQRELIRDTDTGDNYDKYKYTYLDNTLSLILTQGENGGDGYEFHGDYGIESFELVDIENNCYKTIGVQPFKQEVIKRFLGTNDPRNNILLQKTPLNDVTQWFFNRNKLFKYPQYNSTEQESINEYVFEMDYNNDLFNVSINGEQKKTVYVYNGDDAIQKFGYKIVNRDDGTKGYEITNKGNENILLLKKCNNCGTYYSYNYQDCTNPSCKDTNRDSVEDNQGYPGCFIDISNSIIGLGGGKLYFAKWALSINDNSNSYSEVQIDYRTYKNNTINNAQPLFTCNKDEVDINGYHFPYSEQEFDKTKHIYIRVYRGEFAYPFGRTETIHKDSNQQIGYRDWVLQEIPDKPGRYRKLKVFNTRGLSASVHPVQIDYDGNTEDGYFDAQNVCLSHEKQESGLWEAKKYDKWFPQVQAKYCIVFDYVDITQAWCKNYLDYQAGRPSLNRHSPVRIKMDIQKKTKVIPIDMYGKYYLGPYAYASQRQRQHYYQYMQSMENGDYTAYKTYWINNSNSNNLPYYNQNFRETKFMDERRYSVNYGYNNWIPTIITEERANITKEQLESNSDITIWYKKYINSNSYSTATSTFSKYKRYNETWKNVSFWDNYSNSTAAYAEVTIDPFSPDFKMNLGWIMQHGYQPTNTLETYYIQDKDGIYAKGALIPLGSQYVYDLIKDRYDSFVLKDKISTYMSFASDKSSVLYLDKYLPNIDYPLINKFYTTRYAYFSGFPRSWHEAFSTRPDIVYPYDNPIRILGKIGEGVTSTVGGFDFIELQDSWNGYNRLNFNVDYSNNDRVYFVAVEQIKQGNFWIDGSNSFDVKIANSIQDDEGHYYYILRSSIDNDPLSTLIDNMGFLIDSNSGFNDNSYYRLIPTIVSGNSKRVYDGSKRIQIRKDAVSPATITDVTYDKWTGRFTITFRFDDYYGRNYDVLNVQFESSTIEYSNSSAITESEWKDIPFATLYGELFNLNSNMYGDNVATQSMINTHTLWFEYDLSQTSIFQGLRFKIQADLSENRERYTLPIFTVKMWANEFLKPAEEQIKKLQGYKSNYVWTDDYYYIDSNSLQSVLVPGHWDYISNSQEAPYIEGKIDNVKNRINVMEQAFQSHYCEFAKFVYKDLDAFQTYLKKNVYNFESLPSAYAISSIPLYDYYRYCYNSMFENFLSQKGYMTFFDDYISSRNWINYNINYLHYLQRTGFLNLYRYNDEYDLYIENHRMKYLIGFAESNSGIYNAFSNGFVAVQDKDYYVYQYITSNSDRQWGSNSNGLEIYADYLSRGGSPNYEDFLISINYYNRFFNYYANTVLYPDTRFNERKTLYNNMRYEYSTSTSFINHLTLEIPNYASYFTESDYISAYLTYKGLNYVNNDGQLYARTKYMNNKEGGFTLSQKYQSLVNELNGYENELTIARQIKIICETDHRKNLIHQGYFCNGFWNNQPYKSNSTSVNVCFRWRTETEPYEGTYESNYIESSNANDMEVEENTELLNKLARYKMYFRFQMDFYDTFNSQNGQPLRDIFFATDPTSTKKEITRIVAAQMNADSSIKSSYYDVIVSNSLPDIYKNRQFASTFSLPWSEMPGQHKEDFVPQLYYSNSTSYNFTQTYYWRTASYNLLERLIFDVPQITTKSVSHVVDEVTNLQKYNAVLKINYASKEITECFYDDIYDYIPGTWNKSWRYFIYVATSLNSNSIWLKNYDLTCPYSDSNSYSLPLSMSCFKSFNSDSIVPFNNDWINDELLQQGTVQFITDRPRQYISNSTSESRLEFIEDNINNFGTSWIPFNPIRHKPSVIRKDGVYYLFSHKSTATRSIKINGVNQRYNCNKITMSRGFSSDVFGEECTVFPRYSFQTVSDVINGALSFDNPYIRYNDGIYYLYFNVLFANNNKSALITKIYRAQSYDLDVWTDFTQIAQDDIGTYPCVVNTPQDKYLMFVAKNNEMYCYWNSNSQSVSESQITFINQERIRLYEDFGNIGAISAIYQQDTIYRLYFSINGNLYYSDFDYSTLDDVSNSTNDKNWLNSVEMQVVKKSFDSNNENKTESDSTVDYTNYCFNPCVMEDTDYGTQILRLYYNTYSYPYVYKKQGNEMIYTRDDKHREVVINTRYLEKYVWKQVNLFNHLISQCNYQTPYYSDYEDEITTWKNNYWTYQSDSDKPFYPIRYADSDIVVDSNSNTYTLPLLRCFYNYEGPQNNDVKMPLEVNHPYLHLSWLDSDNYDVLAIKMLIKPINKSIYVYSQSRWIDFNNVNQTQAILRPEYPDFNYNLNDYSIYNYITQNDEIFKDYNEWILQHREYGSDEQSVSQAMYDFIVQTYRYNDYIKWSRKGPGIFYFNTNISKYNWNGKEATSSNSTSV